MTSVWPYDKCTPYDILGVSPSATVAEIRQHFKKMALQTHPDKKTAYWYDAMLGEHRFDGREAVKESSGIPFYLVKEAVEVLLDPFLRQQYDQMRNKIVLRTVGASSETCNLADDFVLVSSLPGSSFGGRWFDIYQRECRCGGIYEITQFKSGTGKETGITESIAGDRGRSTYCECDTCSLVVEVVF